MVSGPRRAGVVHLALGLEMIPMCPGIQIRSPGLASFSEISLPAYPLLAGCARQFDAVLARDVLGVSRAVPAGLRRGAAPDVLDAEVGLRILDERTARWAAIFSALLGLSFFLSSSDLSSFLELVLPCRPWTCRPSWSRPVTYRPWTCRPSSPLSSAEPSPESAARLVIGGMSPAASCRPEHCRR